MNDETEIRRAVSMNTARRFPAPKWHSRSGSISVCGNGPSLRWDYPLCGPIAALNGAWKALAIAGVTPDYIIVHDPAPENVAWFDDAPESPVYLLASRVHPSVFEKLAGKNIVLWHMHDQAEAETGSKVLIGGGFTIGCRSLNLLNMIGFNHFDCYGYDSCYALTGENHATPQNWNITPPQLYQVGDEKFIAEPWMAAQVQEFLKQIEANRFNYTVEVHGDGYLRAALEHNTLEVLYDLEHAPGSFDFLGAMLNVENYKKANGYSRVHVNFKAGSHQGFRPVDLIDIGHEHKNLMLNNVVRPMLKMFAMNEVGSVSGKAMQFQYLPRMSVEHFKETGEMPRFEASPEATGWAQRYKGAYVITLREAHYWPQRNSNVEAWVRFARTLDRPVVFVRDTAKANEDIPGFDICPEASIDLHKRLALYRAAEMNFFVTNGPAGLAHYSRDIPYINFFKEAPGYPCYDPAWMKEAIGFEDQMPWASPRQRMIYADDTFENIEKAFEEVRNIPHAA
jgi:uncharacterized Rossmann fold enzyme